ncbi:two-component system sensor histidine kinase NtrB [Pelobacter propionicus]|uniref:histidine kinase n=1 Tax=Pelobacter propionicus (strain DSM 2379 / NBRC 103807 / OttBd1) TaxID=338966 RepID=A1ARZ5_PELPD|nr:ATP-binding protein [Pelobacter propionicus]ABL00116.1 multi-sensor signal transduction histidine kinase [Pelobacter propionicus DSM 2379]
MWRERQLRIFIYARILVSFLFLVSTVALMLKEPEAMDDITHNGVIRLMAFSFLFSAISHFSLKLPRFRHFITYLQTIWDLLFVTVLLLFTGGVDSPYSFLYLLSIMNAGVLLGRREAFYTASLCGILYGAISDFQYFGYLEVIGLSREAAHAFGGMQILYNIFMNLMGFGLTGFITGYLSQQARQNADALERKNVNLEELERLNRTIVANLESGLITVTREGTIRVFNRYAEELTKKTQQDVYDLPLERLFPEMAASVRGEQGRTSSGECAWKGADGEALVLGYSSVPFSDGRGELAGAIINFKDLTDKIRMEEALRRSDKLAVLGSLAARMAHEIRNPLAAMSGSVQLLADHGTVAENDQRLLAIILRETDRLNALITSFLTYARPVSPHKERISLGGLIDEVRLLVSSDRRFGGITLTAQVPERMTISADQNQLRQVLINLLNNAAEAMPEGGRVEISAHLASPEDGDRAEQRAVITVSDSGSGITDEVAAHLFEPFWTTKSDGCGLGLAITYRIIEEHGGTITAESPPWGGCRITISLPA